MKKRNQKMWAVTESENGKPQFHRFTNGPCPTCGLRACLPDHPHGPGKFYHVKTRRFITIEEVDTNGGRLLGPGLPAGFHSLKEYEQGLERKREERRRKVREYVRRHRERKRLAGSRM